MSLGQRVSSDHQLARLLQIGMVLEEVVEVRAHHQYRSLSAAEREALSSDIKELLEHAATESKHHREKLEELIEALDSDAVAVDEVESLVSEKYAGPSDFDGVLYDQLNGEETAYKFYDDLIVALEDSDTEFGVDREYLLSVLRDIRADEEAGAQWVADVMEARE